MKRTLLLALLLFVATSVSQAAEPMLLKRTIYITPQKFLRYWKNPKAAEPDYNTNTWYPRIKFEVLGPVPDGAKYFVEFDRPNGTPWVTVDMFTPRIGDDELETIKPASLDSSIEEKKAIPESGTFPFRIKYQTASGTTTIFSGKFNVVMATLDQSIPENKGRKEFVVDYDWHLPVAYVWLNPIQDYEVPYLSTWVCLKGNVPSDSVESLLFYQGKQIAQIQNTTYSKKEEMTSGSNEPHHRYTIVQTDFQLVRGYDNSSNKSNHSAMFFMDKNPGEYEVRIMRKGTLSRSIKFTVGRDGKIVDPGYAKTANLGGIRMIFPASISGTLDGTINKDAWQTQALFYNPLAGFSVP